MNSREDRASSFEPRNAGETFALEPGPANSRRWMVLLVLCLTLLVASLDATILNVALPTIVRRLHATSSQLQWMVDAYAIVFAGLLMIAGSLGDRLGRKWVYVAGIGIFAIGSALSASMPFWRQFSSR